MCLLSQELVILKNDQISRHLDDPEVLFFPPKPQNNISHCYIEHNRKIIQATKEAAGRRETPKENKTKEERKKTFLLTIELGVCSDR